MTPRAGVRATCPACQGSSLAPTSLCEQPFSICKGCGCVFANPLPEGVFDSAGFYLQEQPSLDVAMTEVEACQLRIREIERFKARGTLLDVGCGLGYLVKAAEMTGWRAAGCDLSAACCEFGRETLRVRLFNCGYQELPGMSGIHTADVITANHVLEHLGEPSEFVRFADNILIPGGVAVVEIPNLFSFESLYRGESWHGLALPHHVTFFTTESLSCLFQPAFRVRLVEYSVAEYFHENVGSYLRRLTLDAGAIDRFARQFSGTAMVAYIEKVGTESREDRFAPVRRPLPYRAVRKLWRTLSRRR